MNIGLIIFLIFFWDVLVVKTGLWLVEDHPWYCGEIKTQDQFAYRALAWLFPLSYIFLLAKIIIKKINWLRDLPAK